jgi:hypothetical protein
MCRRTEAEKPHAIARLHIGDTQTATKRRQIKLASALFKS